ncbi:hypothetical protein ACIQOW_16380 [Kitasatospora sp. NPDC091335]|uniref:hypothetical protein n=1 Tax=Kitasatospora sp. NPDC091335 TaxID=3364085 RepID=UPI003804B060
MSSSLLHARCPRAAAVLSALLVLGSVVGLLRRRPGREFLTHAFGAGPEQITANR